MAKNKCSDSPEVKIVNAIGYLQSLFNMFSPDYKMVIKMEEKKNKSNSNDELPF